MKFPFWLRDHIRRKPPTQADFIEATQEVRDALDIFVATRIHQFPHCDPRVLHAPRECSICDAFQDWQALRIAWGIAFSGHDASKDQLTDPATQARGTAWKEWEGNRAYPQVCVQCCENDDDGDGNCDLGFTGGTL